MLSQLFKSQCLTRLLNIILIFALNIFINSIKGHQMNLSKVVGDKIRRFRISLNLNQLEFGTAAGLTQSVISNIEKGKRYNLKDFQAIAEAYKLDETFFNVKPEEKFLIAEEESAEYKTAGARLIDLSNLNVVINSMNTRISRLELLMEKIQKEVLPQH